MVAGGVYLAIVLEAAEIIMVMKILISQMVVEAMVPLMILIMMITLIMITLMRTAKEGAAEKEALTILPSLSIVSVKECINK